MEESTVTTTKSNTLALVLYRCEMERIRDVFIKQVDGMKKLQSGEMWPLNDPSGKLRKDIQNDIDESQKIVDIVKRSLDY